MPQTETLGEQAILRIDHVGVIVFREFCSKAIRGLRTAAVTDAVWNDEVVFRRIEWLAGTEQLAGEVWREHAGRRTAGAVEYQNGLTRRFANGRVMYA